MTLSRRSFLTGCCAVVLSTPCLGLPAQPASLRRFIELSATLTGFPSETLDRERAEMYYLVLDGPILQALLDGVVENSPEQERLENQLIELWYSGILPGETGSRVVAYRHSLAWEALDFAYPPTYCGPSWWT